VRDSEAVKVLVAMSGGVDSSVAASLLLEQGHEVAGVTLRLWDGPSDSGCCSVDEVLDAARVADQLGIEHHVFDLSEDFERHVVEPFVAAHLAGSTPNPCIECNRHVKFDLLLAAALRLGFDRLATGHHARIERGAGGPSLLRGVDCSKDQSYVLSMLSAAQLVGLELPVGAMTKSAVREHAAKRGLRTAGKPDSQDLCFIGAPGGRAGFLASRAELTPGSVLEASTGRVVGQVAAVELVTVGQRKGLGRDEEGRRRVAVAVRPAAAVVLVAPPEASEVAVVDLDPTTSCWTGAALEPGSAVLVQLRAHADAVAGIWQPTRIELEERIAPVAPGQTAALYDLERPERVLGSAKVVA
jgi:tRNA-specific 2-thiouridylase